MAEKSQSLAAKTGLTEPKLPAIFSESSVQVKPRQFPPYVSFVHPMAKELWPKVCAKFPDAKEGQQFLIDGDNITRLNPFKYALMTAKQYWVMSDNTGTPKQTSLTEKSFPFKEVIDAVVLVYLEDKIIPATCQFRSVKTGACHPMVVALTEAATPDWGKKSKAHELTLQATKPFMRFYGTVSLGNPKTGKTSGNQYIPASVTVHPTGATEWKLLSQCFDEKNSGFYEALQTSASTFERRIAEIEALLSK